MPKKKKSNRRFHALIQKILKMRLMFVVLCSTKTKLKLEKKVITVFYQRECAHKVPYTVDHVKPKINNVIEPYCSDFGSYGGKY
jgi:hypothetical protein